MKATSCGVAGTAGRRYTGLMHVAIVALLRKVVSPYLEEPYVRFGLHTVVVLHE